MVVSPDAGGAKRAAAIADSLGLGFALVHKGEYLCERRNRKLTLVTFITAASSHVQTHSPLHNKENDTDTPSSVP